MRGGHQNIKYRINIIDCVQPGRTMPLTLERRGNDNGEIRPRCQLQCSQLLPVLSKFIKSCTNTYLGLHKARPEGRIMVCWEMGATCDNDMLLPEDLEAMEDTIKVYLAALFAPGAFFEVSN